MAMAGDKSVNTQPSEPFRHSAFLSDTFDFLDEFEENGNIDAGCHNNNGPVNCTKYYGSHAEDLDAKGTRDSEAEDRERATDDNGVIFAEGTKCGILHVNTDIESNSSAVVNGSESLTTAPNGVEPNEDRTGCHIDHANPHRRTNDVNGTGVRDDGANQNSSPAKESFKTGQNRPTQSHNSSSNLIKNSSMPGCHGNPGGCDELGMGTLTEGKTNGIASLSCGVRADGTSDVAGTMCAENMEGTTDSKEENSKEKLPDSGLMGVHRSLSSQDDYVLTNGNKKCDISDATVVKIPGSVSMPGNLECSRGPTLNDTVTTKSDDAVEICVRSDDVIDSADNQNCDEKLKGESSPVNCDLEENGCINEALKNGLVESKTCKKCPGKNSELNGTKGITVDEVNSEDSASLKRSTDSDLDSEVKVVLRRSAANSPSRFSETSSSRGTSEDEDDDEDAGVYAETHRYSTWMFADEEGKLSLTPVIFEDGNGATGSDAGDDAFIELDEKDLDAKTHRRLESQSSTASEREFKRKYQHVSRKVVKRKSSLQAYERLSERICEPEHEIVLTRESADQDFGFHIKGSQPTYISTVVPGSIAHEAGVQVGEIIVTVNGVNCMEATHDEVLEILLKDPQKVVLDLSKCSSNPDDASEEPIMTGYLMKQGGTGILKTWRKRYFVLKRDHCLYYYKSEMDKDPIGAILLSNYMITKVPDTGLMGRKYAFKAVKYSAKTYYFAADSEHEMINWANALNELAKSAGRTDTWLDISSPNVDVPALSIKNPDCHGNLCKMGIKRRHWRRRYCVLKDACIYYYLDVNATTAQGVAHLHGYTVLDSSPQNRKFTFTLQPPEERMRMFYFSTDNETDLNRWTSSLRRSIARWVRVD